MYGDLGQVSSYCYKKITIQANGKTANGVPIVDACPGCQGPGGLDMTPGLFSYFIDQSAGVGKFLSLLLIRYTHVSRVESAF